MVPVQVGGAGSESVVFRPSYGLDPAALWTAVSIVPESLFVKAVDLIPVRRSGGRLRCEVNCVSLS